MSGIFISYRRTDASGYAGALYQALTRRFGKKHVFMDIDTLQPGLDFGHALDEAVSTCDVLIALIGPGWSNAVDGNGRRRLDDPEDFVRIEIATALDRDGIRVIPVLVGNASMPRAEMLPDDLKSLSRRHNFELSDERWEYDVQRLITRLEPLITAQQRLSRKWLAATVMLVSIVIVGVYFMRFRSDDNLHSTPLSVNVAVCADGSNTEGCKRVPTSAQVQASEGGRTSRGQPWVATDDAGWVTFDRSKFTGETIDLMLEHVTKARFACTDIDSGNRISTEWITGREGNFIRLTPISAGPITCDVTLLNG